MGYRSFCLSGKSLSTHGSSTCGRCPWCSQAAYHTLRSYRVSKADSTAPENSDRTERGSAYERHGLCCSWYAPVLLSDSLLLLNMMFLRLTYSNIYLRSPRLAIYGPNQPTNPIILAFSPVILVENGSEVTRQFGNSPLQKALMSLYICVYFLGHHIPGFSDTGYFILHKFSVNPSDHGKITSPDERLVALSTFIHIVCVAVKDRTGPWNVLDDVHSHIIHLAYHWYVVAEGLLVV